MFLFDGHIRAHCNRVKGTVCSLRRGGVLSMAITRNYYYYTYIRYPGYNSTHIILLLYGSITLFLVHRAHTQNIINYNKSSPIDMVYIVNVVTGKSGDLSGYQRGVSFGRSETDGVYFHNFEHATAQRCYIKTHKKKNYENNFVPCRFIVLQWKVTQRIKIPEIPEFADLFDLERVEGEKLLATSSWNTFSKNLIRIGGIPFFTVATLKT